MKALLIVGTTALFASCAAPSHHRAFEPELTVGHGAAEQRAQVQALAIADLELRVRTREATRADLERRARLDETAVQNLEAALAGTCSAPAATSATAPAADPPPTVHQVPVDANDPTRGSANAPVTLVLFLGLDTRWSPELLGMVDQLMVDRPGKLRVVFKPLVGSNFHNRPHVAQKAALCAHRQGMLWPYLGQLFDHEDDWSSRATEDEELDNFARYAQRLGINEPTWRTCVTSHATEGLVSASQTLAKTLGLPGPTVFINGLKLNVWRYAQLQRVVDEELAKASGEVAPANAEPRESTVHKLVVDAATPRRGPTDAPVQLVVFFDMRSGYSRQLAPVLRRLEHRYAGKVAIAYKHFLHSSDSIARGVALGAACMHQQGKFWDFEAVVGNMAHIIRPSDLPHLVTWVGVFNDPFENCLTSASAKQVVDRDLTEGIALGVRDAATLFINGRRFNSRSGGNTFEELTAVIDTHILVEGSK